MKINVNLNQLKKIKILISVLCFLTVAGCAKNDGEPVVIEKPSMLLDSDEVESTPVETPEVTDDVEDEFYDLGGITLVPREKKRYSEVEQIVKLYAKSGDSADSQIQELFTSLEGKDEDVANQWREILALWKMCNVNNKQMQFTLNYDELPDGLSQSDNLCIVVLGFQLNSDGTIKDELKERLIVAKKSAEKYPNSYILCTGGGTASRNYQATEAGEMKKWLVKEGIDANRVIVENKSLSTSDNAIKSLEILAKNYPGINEIAIVSSDYHISTGMLLFGAESILNYDSGSSKKFEIVSNASYGASRGGMSVGFQANSLMELYDHYLKK